VRRRRQPRTGTPRRVTQRGDRRDLAVYLRPEPGLLPAYAPSSVRRPGGGTADDGPAAAAGVVATCLALGPAGSNGGSRPDERVPGRLGGRCHRQVGDE